MRRSINHSSFKILTRRKLIALHFLVKTVKKMFHEIFIGSGAEKRITKKCNKHQLKILGVIIYLEVSMRCKSKWQFLVEAHRDVHKRVSGLSLHPV